MPQLWRRKSGASHLLRNLRCYFDRGYSPLPKLWRGNQP